MKRFTETGKWDDRWFRGLSPYQKLVFLFLVDRCNNAGFLEIDHAAIAFGTGIPEGEIEGAIKGLSRGLSVIDGWAWIHNFLRHQKNENLNPENNAHKQIIALTNAQIDRFSECREFRSYVDPKQGLFSPIGKGRGNGNGLGKRVKEEGAGRNHREEGDWSGLPDAVNTDAFKAAWLSWVAYRKQRKLPVYVSSSVLVKWNQLARIGEAAAIAAIEHSIGNNYDGIYEPGRKPATAADRKEVERTRTYGLRPHEMPPVYDPMADEN